ncbi:MAG: DNA gyrase/topoisomerase IV subunit A [Phaeodactylibacter xiamenensis]|uniref:DNA topoisomerase IV subunit A n=1 Tax=Phaeodactylibacter xiamenensis TaxID=1524460 RepID=A0A098S813_9BACT|nr:DNA gyrase/topoisomerase IV subunit A [Phaeodactylibacter xiamenensis]KGE88714.1 DNA topoisomerase IV subunit A [Phaeodactylibacter xiamenensis]MCR9052482.1 DNA gyrase/topoisomerase IV subunit A [bacterium]
MSETAEQNGQENIITLKGMYEDYFLDYASYVILERAVPGIIDGLKPVQRRILHAMREMHDGRYHKVANIIGQTMQYHPHGDAAIGDALVNLGQKDLLIDPQGNWGDVRTGDSAAAPRYIEARLTKFALEVAFNPQTTDWQLSYDGRKKEPIGLPMKFPMLLAQGADGIAVGLSTKILPHNFNELIKASIKLLQGKRVKIYPDFQTGGMIDVSDYRSGKRGGRVKVRAKIEAVDKSTLAIRELPYATTTQSLIDSILKANDKGKIKIKKVVDNTAEHVEVLVELGSGVSPDLTIDALYAFTNCEISISPNACVIIEDKPHFMTVEDILDICTQQTKALLKRELEIRKAELLEKLHFASLEKIFIENRIYRDIEQCETWEAVLEAVDSGLRKYVRVPGEKPKKNDDRLELLRDITEDDLVRLTEIRIKRISKYNTFKAEEQIKKLEEELKEVQHHLDNLTDYAIAYYENLLQKFGKGKERRTIITTFENIEATEVVAKNAKLYVDRKEGFFGTGLKKDEFVCECSDIADIIVFRKDGKYQVSRIADKVFAGKDIIHIDVWKKGDDRTTYNAIYVDGKTGRTFAKRFQVQSITRDREYDMTTGENGSKPLYFTANPNGEAEVVTVQLTQGSRARNKVFDYDFSELEIKGRSSKGNTVTKYPVRKVSLKEEGESTLGAIKIWMDEVSGRLNTDERGLLLGEFSSGDHLFAIYKEGAYEVIELDLNKKFEPKEIVSIGKFDPDAVISAVYYEGERGWSVAKRFQVETTSTNQRFLFITEHKKSKLLFASPEPGAAIQYQIKEGSQKIDQELDIEDFIDVKGWRAMGNKVADQRLLSVSPLKKETAASSKDDGGEKLKPGDSIDFDVEDDGQTKMFD